MPAGISAPQYGSTFAMRMLVANVVIRHCESAMARKREAFLKLANNALSFRKVKPDGGTNLKMKAVATPKKRRLEDGVEQAESVDTAEQTSYCETFTSATPARIRVIPTTPHRSSTADATPPQYKNSSRKERGIPTPAVTTPSREPLSNLTNTQHAKQFGSPAGDGRSVGVDSLSERLRLVEESLNKLSTSTSTPRKAMPMEDPRPAPPTATMGQQPTGTASAQGQLRTNPADLKDAPAVPPVAAPLFSGAGKGLQTPITAEHPVLQAAIHRATRASMQTLLRRGDPSASTVTATSAPPPSGEVRDALAAYRQDNMRIDCALRQQSMPASMPVEARADGVIQAVVAYHHTRSDLAPLSPLGDQGARVSGAPPVALSQLSLLQEKLGSWRSKYGGNSSSTASFASV